MNPDWTHGPTRAKKGSPGISETLPEEQEPKVNVPVPRAVVTQLPVPSL